MALWSDGLIGEAMNAPEPTKVCKRCNDPKPLSQYGVNGYYLTWGACDGRQPVCKDCINSAMAKRRETYRARKALLLKPAPKPKEKAKVNPVVEVMKAIHAGYRTRDRIRFYTALDEDSISDALATLAFDDESVVIDRSGAEPRFDPVEKVAA